MNHHMALGDGTESGLLADWWFITEADYMRREQTQMKRELYREIEIGECPECGVVESERYFDYDRGERCPDCNNRLEDVWCGERLKPAVIASDTDASSYLDEDVV